MVEETFKCKPDHWRDALVLLLAHGSETTPSAADLVKSHAAELAGRKLFAQVKAVFLRDTPHPRDVIDQATNRDVYVIPYMISEGYSIETLIPSALGLTGPLTEKISTTGRRRIHVCHSIGTHSQITDHVVMTINQLVSKHSINRHETTMLIAAHGTKRHPGNNQQSNYLVDQVIERCGIEDTHAAFLSEPPFIADWRLHSVHPHIIVLPYLMTNGSHAVIDVPRAFGIPIDAPKFRKAFSTGETYGPHEMNEQKMWYLPVIGRYDRISDIVVDRIQDWDREQ